MRPDSQSHSAFKDDQHWMNEAFQESLKASGLSNPNPAVGCVIVKDGVELARGHTQAYRGKHAERMAVESIADRSVFAGATAYVTLEPCSHHGHQPPCCELLATLGLARTVVGRVDTDKRVRGRGATFLRDKGIRVDCGLLEKEITALNLPFFASHVLDRPFFALKWAQTLDGQLADDLGYSHWISNSASRSYGDLLREKYDAILLGAGALIADAPPLEARQGGLSIILDPRGELARLTPQQRPRIESPVAVFSPHPIEWAGVSWFPLSPAIEPAEILSSLLVALKSQKIQSLLNRPLQSILVEGGPTVLTWFIEAKLADLLHVFVSTKLTGGRDYRLSPSRLLSEAESYERLSSRSFTDELSRSDDLLLELIRPELREDLTRGLT